MGIFFHRSNPSININLIFYSLNHWKFTKLMKLISASAVFTVIKNFFFEKIIATTALEMSYVVITQPCRAVFCAKLNWVALLSPLQGWATVTATGCQSLQKQWQSNNSVYQYYILSSVSDKQGRWQIILRGNRKWCIWFDINIDRLYILKEILTIYSLIAHGQLIIIILIIHFNPEFEISTCQINARAVNLRRWSAKIVKD